MPLTVDGFVTGSISGDATINGNISSTQSVSGEVTTDISGGVTEIYWANYYTDTFASLQTAYQAGKQIILRIDGLDYTLSHYDGNRFLLTAVLGERTSEAISVAYIQCTEEDDWRYNQIHVVDKNYNSLYNKPSINDVALSGSKTAADFGLANAADVHNIPSGGSVGDIMIKRSSADYDAGWVAPANAVEQDNTLPITSAAVYTEIGNINALLATI